MYSRKNPKVEWNPKTKSWYVNDKYEITHDTGTVYYLYSYTGRKTRDFPQWIYKLSKELRGIF